MNPQEIPFPVIDGFVLNTDLRCDLTFQALVVEQYDSLRRSRSFRSKAWCIPNDTSTFPIPARDSYEYQVYMKPGSAIWGYSFTGDASGGQIDPTNPGDSFQVREACTDVPLFSEFITKNGENTWARQQFLSKLLIVPPPGLLNVQIATVSPLDRSIQLILWGGEPA